ncbi:MAG: hypothetical protein ACOYB4_02470 [Methyloceanibacter sp.]
MSIVLDAETNTMTASLHVGDGVLLPNPRYNLEFGGEGNSAYIDDGIFAAFENQAASGVEETVLVPITRTRRILGKEVEITVYEPRVQTYAPEMQGYIVSANAINANAVLFPGETVPGQNGEAVQKQAFCQDCDFIKWGAWGSRLDYQNHDGQNVAENIHLGWWIAGNVVSPSDMPTTGSATYKGDAIGNVASKIDGAWNQYVATGKMNMTWFFAPRAGTLRIENFDTNKNFTGLMLAPGANPQQFSGLLTGSGMAGAASGAFVGPNGGLAPRGVIGNFGVGNPTYQATGIFGGVKQ